MRISTAISTERRSRTQGYKIKKGFFDNDTGNLPQIIAVLGEANSANQASLSTVKKEITTAQEAAEEYGYGSPLHQIFRILRPKSGPGVGGIPTIAMAQESDAGATATSHEWTVGGAVTKNATHTFVIAGRRVLDFQEYSFTVKIGDTPTDIASNIADAINGVLSSPVLATSALGVLTLTTKWKGETSAKLVTSIDNNANPAGVTYSKTDTVDGAGAVDIAGALNQFGTTWYTIVINPYDSKETILSALEQFNGFPDDEAPTGRYAGDVFMPFISLFGSRLDDKDDLAAITDASARKGENTNALCPAPLSKAFPAEIAANMAVLFARIAQDTPELDVNAKSYPDLPAPDDEVIGDMSIYDNRDFLLKKGCSTVILKDGRYQVQDFVTTYHPDGEIPLQYNYCRNLMVDFNIKDAYEILVDRNVRDHVLVEDGQITDAAKSVKPKQWKAVLFDFFDDIAERAIIREPSFSKDSLRVAVSEDNPNRFDTFFRYRRTGVARISSTDVEAGF